MSPPPAGVSRPAGDPARTTAIVAALGDEIAPLRRRLADARRVRVGGVRAVTGRLGSETVLLAVLGEGAERSSGTLDAILTDGEIDRVLLVGISGGLSPDLACGDLVLGAESVNGAGPPRSLDATWLGPGARLLERGVLVAASRIVNDPADREAMWRRLERPARAAVDLESSALARTSARRSTPFAAVRIVVDTADDPLPLDFSRFQDETGRVRRSRVVLAALRRPAVIPRLAALRRRVVEAAESLADAVDALFAARHGA